MPPCLMPAFTHLDIEIYNVHRENTEEEIKKLNTMSGLIAKSGNLWMEVIEKFIKTTVNKSLLSVKFRVIFYRNGSLVLNALIKVLAGTFTKR